ncbi:MAG: 7-cyano-7-deazaguanine synthase [Sodalinema sp.]|uniref:7-cyano-7-deazaguanine synthase n=1 Tax=Sodalinema sp. TaxID=3080550 RepID=UPI00396F2BB0
MPDGDIVHSKIKGFYRNPYRILCEQSADEEPCTRELLKALKKDLQGKGDQPITLVCSLEKLLSNELSPNRCNKSVDWGALSDRVTKLINQSDMHHYCGGLDALAGLYTRLTSNNKKSFMLFGTGANLIVSKRQHKGFKELQREFINRVSLSQLTFSLEHKEKRSSKKKMLRTRGVVFTLLGSAYAYLMDCNVLNLYENGIGAINLPYTESTVGLDHSRSTHPLTLLKVSNLVSDIFGEIFKIRNPFLFSTKAQMCQSLARNKKADLSALTQSCDRPHRRKPVQCGYCSSCILRRQAILASNLNDKNHYIVPHAKQGTNEDCIFLDNMWIQVNTLREIFKESKTRQSQWISLTKNFPVLDDIVDQTATMEGITEEEFRINLIKLFQAYINEWGHVEFHLWRDFSRNPIGSHKTRDIVP